MGLINVYMYAKLLGGITRLGIGGEERQGSPEVEGGRIQWEDQQGTRYGQLIPNLCKCRILYAHLQAL